jgi:hypothetical protein
MPAVPGMAQQAWLNSSLQAYPPGMLSNSKQPMAVEDSLPCACCRSAGRQYLLRHPVGWCGQRAIEYAVQASPWNA